MNPRKRAEREPWSRVFWIRTTKAEQGPELHGVVGDKFEQTK
jgi:hypothetical protein